MVKLLSQLSLKLKLCQNPKFDHMPKSLLNLHLLIRSLQYQLTVKSQMPPIWCYFLVQVLSALIFQPLLRVASSHLQLGRNIPMISALCIFLINKKMLQQNRYFKVQFINGRAYSASRINVSQHRLQNGLLQNKLKKRNRTLQYFQLDTYQ